LARSESVKKKALDLIQALPPTSTWDDIMYELYVRQKVDTGVAAAIAGRVVDHADVKRRFAKRR
jgi:hypothetical protein